MQTYACNCIGPQNGEPLCPCKMRNVVQRNGRYIKIEQDLGPVKQPLVTPVPWTASQGCICPPGAERTCQGPLCPRKPLGSATSAVAVSISRDDGCHND